MDNIVTSVSIAATLLAKRVYFRETLKWPVEFVSDIELTIAVWTSISYNIVIKVTL